MISDQIIKDAENWYYILSSSDKNDVFHQEFKIWYEQDRKHQEAYAQVFMCHDEGLYIEPLMKRESRDETVTNDSALMKKIVSIAAMMIIAIIGVNIYFSPPETTSFSTQTAETRVIKLNDGSFITLGASSHIRVLSFEGKERRVLLERGEALFDIVRNPEKPFIVQTGKTKVIVLGTKFNLNLNQAGEYLAISLLEGKVEVIQQIEAGFFFDEEEVAMLTPAQMLIVDKGVLQKPKARNIKQMAGWTEGKLSYFNVPLSVVISDINRYSYIPFTIKDKTLKSLPVSAVFGTDQVEIMMQGLALILPITITRDEKGFSIARLREAK